MQQRHYKLGYSQYFILVKNMIYFEEEITLLFHTTLDNTVWQENNMLVKQREAPKKLMSFWSGAPRY